MITHFHFIESAASEPLQKDSDKRVPKTHDTRGELLVEPDVHLLPLPLVFL